MEPRLKQRLVGASILVILVVIIVPEIFEDSSPAPQLDNRAAGEAVEQSFNSRIVPVDPEQPAVTDVSGSAAIEDTGTGEPDEENSVASALAAPESGVDTASLEVVATLRVAVPMPKRKPRVTLAEASGLNTWVVQLASFSDNTRAVTLRDTLVENGYAAYIRTTANETGTFSRVLVGPESNRERADQLRAKLLDKTKLEGRVIPFTGE